MRTSPEGDMGIKKEVEPYELKDEVKPYDLKEEAVVPYELKEKISTPVTPEMNNYVEAVHEASVAQTSQEKAHEKYNELLDELVTTARDTELEPDFSGAPLAETAPEPKLEKQMSAPKRKSGSGFFGFFRSLFGRDR